MNSKKMWLALIIIFVSGIIIGLVSGLAIGRRRSFSGFSATGRFRNRIISNITHKLELDDEQHAQTEKIINAMAEQIRRYQTEQRPKIKAVIDKAMGDIAKLLTPEQLQEFTEMRAKTARYRHSHRRGREGREWSEDREHRRRDSERKRYNDKISPTRSLGPQNPSNSLNASGPARTSNYSNLSGPKNSSSSLNSSGPAKASNSLDSLGPAQ